MKTYLKQLVATVLSCTFLLGSLGANAVELITYYHNDPVGSPLAASDEHGNELWLEHYRPFGDRIVRDSKAADNELWFTGKPQDEATGLSFFGARYFDPVLGRFMAIDPVDFQEDNIHSFNRYAYGNNNPYKFVDPDGREALYGIRFEIAALQGRDVEAMRAGEAAAAPYIVGTVGALFVTGVTYGALGPLAAEVLLAGVTGEAALVTKNSNGITKEFLPRKVPGRDGGLSAQIVERQNGEVISRTHKVFKDGKILHQHQNHIGKHRGVRQFPDKWTGTSTKNAPYENIPPKFKPDRVPGGRTF